MAASCPFAGPAAIIDAARMMRAVPPRPFAIDVPQEVLDDLQRRLDATRWPRAIPGTGWDYGADVDYVRELCGYLARRLRLAPLGARAERALRLPLRSRRYRHPLLARARERPRPVSAPLLIHGWPGSIFEYHELIGPLTDPAAHGGDPADALDVVVPALPGFGFGGEPQERGWGPARIAAAFDTLMTRELGYERYGVQGGDWGGIIAARMGADHADHVTAIHITLAPGAPPQGEELNEAEQRALERVQQFQAQETGYSNVQGTKPMSLGIAQADSPAGIAAWIAEKFRTWSDCDGDLEGVYTKDQILTNVMFYWAPNSIASAARIYYESRREPPPANARVEVPVGVAAFPEEVIPAVRRWVEPRFNVQHWTDMPRGGHFAALEAPELLLEDVRAFFRTLR